LILDNGLFLQRTVNLKQKTNFLVAASKILTQTVFYILIMFTFCAIAYLLAWVIMKTLVPKYKAVVA
jgi:hypothetical protein